MLGTMVRRLVTEMQKAQEIDALFDREEGVPFGTSEELTATHNRIDWLVAELDKIGLPTWEAMRDAVESDGPLPPPPRR